MFGIKTIKQDAIAALGALLFTAVTVGAAVGPARAVETAPRFAAAQTSDQAPA